jgi:tRNA (guanine-N7-)-methyltransferase
LELVCGKGEYTVELPNFIGKIFIGIDIKGARIGVVQLRLFPRSEKCSFRANHIELIDHFFAEKEISEIWITFPDPQMNKTNKRLTSTRFMRAYSQLLNENGIVHLKTDSNFLYAYTKEMIRANQLEVYFETDDLYHSEWQDPILQIQTFYEQQWRARGLNIKYIKFACPQKNDWIEPDVGIEKDDYRSFGRNANFNKSIDK